MIQRQKDEGFVHRLRVLVGILRLMVRQPWHRRTVLHAHRFGTGYNHWQLQLLTDELVE